MFLFATLAPYEVDENQDGTKTAIRLSSIVDMVEIRERDPRKDGYPKAQTYIYVEDRSGNLNMRRVTESMADIYHQLQFMRSI